jgi:3,4-dihydroxy-2-butanone 4-phosphate synthase
VSLYARLLLLLLLLPPLPILTMAAKQCKAGDEEEETSGAIARVQQVLQALRHGHPVVVTDGEERENEGDLIIAAEKATAKTIAFMVNNTSGLICCGVTKKRTEELKLEQMVASNNTEAHGTAFTVSVDYKHGTTTGISAADRCATIRALADAKAQATDFNRPGHMFPLRARQGGVLERQGHTEASVDLAEMAGLYPAAALCELVDKSSDEGAMMRPAACLKFAEQHGLAFATIADIIAYKKHMLVQQPTKPIAGTLGSV